MNGSIVGVGVDDLIRVAVPAMVGTFLPEACAIEIWLCDAEQSESSDFDE